MHTATRRLPYSDALLLYRRLRGASPSCLFESASAVDKSSRMSVIGFGPSLELTGKDEDLSVRLLHPRGAVFYDFIRTEFAAFVEKEQDGRLEMRIPRLPFHGPEDRRLERQNIVQPLRGLLARFRNEEKNFMGFYGALGYRFVYLFEDIRHDKPCPDPDFHLFLFDNILLFNHLTRDLTLYVTRESREQAEADLADLPSSDDLESSDEWRSIPSSSVYSLVYSSDDLESSDEWRSQAKPPDERLSRVPSPPVYSSDDLESSDESGLVIGKFAQTPDEETFKKQVARGVQLCHAGELLEIVLSRKLTAPVSGDLLPLYERYKAVNPSPYLFYFDFGDETLLGASPELMLRYENGRATLRPISGSVRRAADPIEDHHLMMELLNSPKENSELDMLIDLGRNDLARICRPGIRIDDYRIIEKYSHVTHTVAQVSGELEAGYSGFDALIASLNAGTLTGAPKIAAMQYIEQIEQHTRGYYGGCIGWLLLNGEVNTAITIRTAHVRDGLLSFCAGATLLYESEPEQELKETKIKAGAFLAAVEDVRLSTGDRRS